MLCAHFCDCEMWNVGPFFGVLEPINIQLLVKLAHALAGSFDSNKDGRSDGSKGFNATEHYLEGLFLAADPFEHLNGLTFTTLQESGRQYRKVSGEVGKVRVKLAAKLLDEFSCWAFDISHQGVTRTWHTWRKIIPLNLKLPFAWRESGAREVIYNREEVGA